MGWQPFIFATDVHGDCQDTAACNALFRFMRDWKPKIRVASECFDFRAWRTKAGPKEQDESTEPDLRAGLSFLDNFRPTHYLNGNHCQRLWMRQKDATDGRVRDLAARYIADIDAMLGKHKATWFPYHKRHGVLKIGHLKFLHGFGNGGPNTVREHARIYGSSLIGHIHSIDEASLPGLDRRVCRSVGALCDLDMDYSSSVPATLRHAHGFAYGVIDDKTGDYQVWQAEGINGRFVVASTTQVIAA